MLPNMSDSPDPVIRYLPERRIALADQVRHIDAILSAYVTYWPRQRLKQPEISALEHYSMLEGSNCGCATCQEWETRRGEFITAIKLVPKGHKWSTCACPICRLIGRIQLNFLAATNRRDLLIETSYHARYHSPHGEAVMAWLETELCRSTYTVNWCAQEMSRYPLEWWLRRCETALGPVVSGVVFRASMMVTDLTVHFPSSLTAIGVYSTA